MDRIEGKNMAKNKAKYVKKSSGKCGPKLGENFAEKSRGKKYCKKLRKIEGKKSVKNDENKLICLFPEKKYTKIALTLFKAAYLSITTYRGLGLGGVRVPILFGNGLLLNDLPYSKGFIKFGCLEPSKVMFEF